ncbi:hypothetical protein DFH09DRAFT_1370213 [Mycena vulgaris]|nr:hypothetical protein DFH09DRAFT_1370213 [Mycena vulgaris]
MNLLFLAALVFAAPLASSAVPIPQTRIISPYVTQFTQRTIPHRLRSKVAGLVSRIPAVLDVKRVDREIVEVTEDSADAKKWPLWRPRGESAASSSTQELQDPPPVSSTPGASTSTARPPTKKLGPRKPKTSLANIPTQKARKLSTLDKSAMDWRAHVNAEPPDMKDELAPIVEAGDISERSSSLIELTRGRKMRWR